MKFVNTSPQLNILNQLCKAAATKLVAKKLTINPTEENLHLFKIKTHIIVLLSQNPNHRQIHHLGIARQNRQTEPIPTVLPEQTPRLQHQIGAAGEMERHRRQPNKISTHNSLVTQPLEFPPRRDALQNPLHEIRNLVEKKLKSAIGELGVRHSRVDENAASAVWSHLEGIWVDFEPLGSNADALQRDVVMAEDDLKRGGIAFDESAVAQKKVVVGVERIGDVADAIREFVAELSGHCYVRIAAEPKDAIVGVVSVGFGVHMATPEC